MSDKAIVVEGLSKKYDLGAISSGTLSKDLNRWWANVRGKEDPTLTIDQQGRSTTEYWALKDVSFDIKKGEVVGIIGKNGAGKSTLLKILSRVTAPTTGLLKIRGRMASLLEVGTGFHPDLTGRENIYMNGAILGMTRNEISTKLEEIISFSGVSQYIDTPVKRYSSGMYVRLAFAVAAHLESEILVVDEVLAVGDAEFQKKCLGKMGQISSKEGRTVLFVSHNMQAVSSLCTHGVILRKGISLPKTSSKEAVAIYTSDNEYADATTFPIVTDEVVIHQFLLKQNGQNLSEYDGGLPIDVTIEFELLEDLSHFRIGFFIKNSTGDLINRSLLADWDEKLIFLKRGRYRLKGHVPAYFLIAGNYIMQVHTSRFGIRDYVTCEPSSTAITINPPEDYNRAYMGENVHGLTLIKQNWQLDYV